MSRRFPPPDMRFPPPMRNSFHHHIPRMPPPFFHSAPPPPCLPARPVLSEREADEMWINDFLRAIGKDKAEQKPVPRLKIREAVEAVDACTATLQQLEQLEQDLAANIESSTEEEWQAKWDAVQTQQTLLSAQLPALPAESALASLAAALACRRRRREQGRRRRKQLAQARRQRQAERGRRHAETDARLRARREEVEAARRAAELGGQAALVLADTARRQHDARSQLQLLPALLRLRELRACASAGRGEPALGGAAFAAAVDSLAAAWKARAQRYNVEEVGLRVMLQHGAGSSALAPRPRPARAQWRRALFGAPRRADPQYVVADNNVHALVDRRCDWDQFLVDAAAPMSSCVPVGWVLPAPPSSPSWKELLADK